MDRIQELLAKIAELSAEELTELETLLSEQDSSIGDVTTREQLEALQAVAAGVEALRAEQTRRAEEQAALEAEAAELRSKIAPVVAETPEEPAEPDTPAEPEVPAEPTDVEPEVPVVVEEPKPQAIAAAAKPKAKIVPAGKPRPAPGAAQVPARNQAKVQKNDLPVITAGGDVHGISAGAQFESMRDVAVAVQRKMEAIGRGGKGSERYTVATFHADYPEERKLGVSFEQNMELIEAVTSPKAIIASGGLCAPLSPVYGQAMVAVADRPVRDSLAQFQADRGGIRWMPPLTLADASGVGVWTNTTDTTPGGSTKSVWTVACGTEQTAVVEAITQIVKFGNFGARTFPERVEAAINLQNAAHARKAEQEILTAIGTGSTAVTAVGSTHLGTTRDVLASIDRMVAGLRYRHRTSAEMPVRIIIPEWLDDNMRTDLARELPGATAERLATADSLINQFYAVRNINVTRALDDVTTPTFAVQAAGGLAPWQSHVILYAFFEGTWLFLDGGTLDLGVVRDSTLNSTNDYELFSESFEAVAKVGPESIKLDVDICPSGATSAAVSFDPCTIGS